MPLFERFFGRRGNFLGDRVVFLGAFPKDCRIIGFRAFISAIPLRSVCCDGIQTLTNKAFGFHYFGLCPKRGFVRR